MKAQKETVIELPQRGGVRGRLERLHQEYLTKAHALRLAADILEEDDRKLALERAPQKFLAALNHRAAMNGNGYHPEPVEREPKLPLNGSERMAAADRKQQLLDYIIEHPGQTTQEIAVGLGWNDNQVHRFASTVARSSGKSGKALRWVAKGTKVAKTKKTTGHSNGTKPRPAKRPIPASMINGQALSLFLLEHLAADTPKTRDTLMEDLAQAGSPLLNKQRFNGPMYAGLMRHGYVKEGKDGFVRTSKGNTYAGELRAELERLGKVPTGGYLH